ncbi:transcription factor bHLH94 [Panicum miliaceum]|uniref:Transcription factor bHLH94 n=1 Tax=Panicum miliaceum TaxID=4540 RepID=A0A3L6RQS8_PANMI|nr:transcription factor bHLH94 [Panicum miliaceum]
MSALVDALCAPPGDAAALIYDTFNAASFLFDGPVAAALYDGAGIVECPAPAQQQQQAADAGLETQATTSSAPTRVRKRRRRARSCKSREETETQRMTHIAVERNRRRQMNEYLAALRSLMPEPYVQRGDQASIVGGAIDFVKELEQQLQCLEAQKRTLLAHQHKAAKPDATPMHHSSSSSAKATAAGTTACMEPAAAATTTSNCSSSVTEDAADRVAPPPFAQFFTYPQYVWCHSPRDPASSSAAEDGGGRPGVADIEVNLVETHASLRVMTPRRPGQLLGLVTGLQALRLGVLHLSVTTLESLVLYSISVKVDEGCGLATVEDIAAAAHHVLCLIDAAKPAEQQQEEVLAASGPR